MRKVNMTQEQNSSIRYTKYVSKITRRIIVGKHIKTRGLRRSPVVASARKRTHTHERARALVGTDSARLKGDGAGHERVSFNFPVTITVGQKQTEPQK